MDKRKIYDRRIQEIIEGEKVLSILLIGAGSKIEEKDFNTLKDIDLFVITDENYGFQREIIEVEDALFDISYMSLDALKKAIDDEMTFLINALQSYRIVYSELEDLEKLLDRIKFIYNRGPQNLGPDEVNYIRFKLYQDYEDIFFRREDVQNSLFLMNNLFREILIAYFKLNNRWVPKDKKILNYLQNLDKILYNLCIDFADEEDSNEKLRKLEEILNYVLMSHGGAIKLWKRGRFPLI